MRTTPTDNRGSALLAVLWLSLALSAIAFSVASTVHGETERVSTAVDGIRSYYLATGAIDRAILYMEWGRQRPPADDLPYYHPGKPVLRMSFPTGEATDEIRRVGAGARSSPSPRTPVPTDARMDVWAYGRLRRLSQKRPHPSYGRRRAVLR